MLVQPLINVKGGNTMDRFLKRSVSETLEEALVSPFFMTTQIYPLERDTIFYTCHIIRLDNIMIRFLGIELVYTEGIYDATCTGIILGKSFSEIRKGFEIDIDPDLKEAIDSAVYEFYIKHRDSIYDKK